MRDRALEERHLRQADQSIREGELRILKMEESLNQALARGRDGAQQRTTLALLTDSLTEMRVWRWLIVRALADIDAEQPSSTIGRG